MKYQLSGVSNASYSETDINGNYTATVTIGVIFLDGIFSGKQQSINITVECNNSNTVIQEEQSIKDAIDYFCTANDIEIPTPNIEEIEQEP